SRCFKGPPTRGKPPLGIAAGGGYFLDPHKIADQGTEPACPHFPTVGHLLQLSQLLSQDLAGKVKG
ncbi:MAG TPA: hypothetical protein DCZ69_13780, partial [Syntrophobacteraceae bacterium]|nr:hypothetical protein [Syntrophobacteraceae bacterium]